jgi:hypothetical protein
MARLKVPRRFVEVPYVDNLEAGRAAVVVLARLRGGDRDDDRLTGLIREHVLLTGSRIDRQRCQTASRRPA